MKIILQEKNKYLIRLDRDEEALGELKKVCRKRKIYSGHFSGLGAAKLVELSHYDLDKKRYSKKIIKQKMEINGLMGIIALLKKEIIIHAHGIFSDKSMNVQAGHVKKLVVAATCEIILEKLNKKIEREYSKKIGLNLLK